MTTAALLELAAGVALFGGGVWLYIRRTRTQPEGPSRYGSQSGTFLILVALILIVDAVTRHGGNG